MVECYRMAPCQRPCARPAQRAAAAYLSLTRNRNGMTPPWYSAPRGHRTTGFSYAFSPQLHFNPPPGLRGPPLPPPSGRNNGDMAFRPGAMQVSRSERQSRLCFRQHAATVDASPQQSQAGLEAEKQSARDLEVLLPAEERGSSGNSLSAGARPLGMSTRPPASSSGRSEAGTVCSTSSSISLQSSTTGKQLTHTFMYCSIHVGSMAPAECVPVCYLGGRNSRLTSCINTTVDSC